MSNLLFDLRHSLRILLKRWPPTLLAVLAMALALGATTVVFGVVNAVLLRSLPYGEPQRLAMLWEKNAARHDEQSRVSPPLIADWREQAGAFAGVAAYWLPNVNSKAGDGTPLPVHVADVSDDFFRVLAVKPLLGRTFQPGEDKPGGERLAVISHDFWQSRFGSDPKILTRSITLDAHPYVVIGVMPAHVAFPARTEVWRPLGIPLRHAGRTARFLSAVARLGPGATFDQARAQLDAIARRLAAEYPASCGGWDANLMPLSDHLVGSVRSALLILFAAVGLVLLIACVNIANLLLAQAAARKSEIALRAALGSSRSRLIRQFLLEGLIIAALGGLLGLLLVLWGLQAVMAFLPSDLPRLDEIGVDLRVVLFTLAVTGCTGIAIGLAPALRFSSRPNLVETLKEVAAGGRTTGRLHDVLVMVEVSIAMIVLVGAGLLVSSFSRLAQVKPGFSTAGELTFNLQPPIARYRGRRVLDLYAAVIERLRHLPGVQSVAGSAFLPLDTTAWNLPLTIEGRVAAPEEQISAQYHSVTPDYFHTLGIPLLAGRSFTERDDAQAPGVIVINQTMARRYWPDGRVLDQTVYPGADNFGILGSIGPKSFKVVGVAADVKNDGLQSAPQPAMYFPYRQFIYQTMSFVVRSSASPASLIGAVRARVREVDPDLAAADAKSMQELLAAAVARQRFNAELLGLFGTAALLLTAIGIYGVIAYGVSRRTHEIGVRMALGESRGRILWSTLRRGLRLTVIGLAAGMLGSIAVSRLLRNLLFEVQPTDPVVFALIALLLISVAVIAALLPSRRATKVDPSLALRHE